MHTVPAGYLREFADANVQKRNPHIWRFDRNSSEPKLISVRDASVASGIYELRRTDGTADNTVENELLAKFVDEGIREAIRAIAKRETNRYWCLRNFSRFVAFQLARTPGAMQLLRDFAEVCQYPMSSNDSVMTMVAMGPKFERWFCTMDWTFCTNESKLPFLTSDNPAVMWADRGDHFEGGVGFMDPEMQILVPLTPNLCIRASQSERSMRNILESVSSDKVGGFSDVYEILLRYEDLDIDTVVRFNQIVVANADRYAYASTDASNVLMFMTDVFLGQPQPVRRFDRKPIGSPTRREGKPHLESSDGILPRNL